MDKTKIQLIYYTETIGNARKILAQLPAQFNNKVIDLQQRRQHEIESSHLVGESIRNIKFIYTYNSERQLSFVKFEIHRFVKNIEMIELLIKLAVDKLEEIK
jgi:hypothetical protein